MDATITSRRALDASMRNVELKARDPDPARTLERALALGAEDRGEIRQRDTYFAARAGGSSCASRRRGGSPGRADRVLAAPDSAGARTSTYRRVPVADAAPLREALDAAYGTLVTLSKRRRLLLWEGVRIHLDDVEGLGTLLELEAVAEPDSDLSAERDKVERLRAELGSGRDRSRRATDLLIARRQLRAEPCWRSGTRRDELLARRATR